MNTKELYYILLEKIKNYISPQELISTTTIIMKDIFNFSTNDIIINKKINLNNTYIEKTIENITKRLKKNEPIQYITGKCNFLNCKILLNKNVLIPRQETEEMVYNIIKINLNNKKIVDMCSGSGCIGISIKKKYTNADVTCVDIDKKAIKISEKNSKINNVKINFINEDIFNENIIEIGNFDILVSNPPYIPEDQKNTLEKKIILYEPHLALFVKKDDPLIFYKRLNYIIEKILNSNGLFFIEIHENFEKEIITLFNKEYIKNIEVHKDLNSKSRWISGKKI